MALSDDDLHALLRDASTYPPCARHLGFELMDCSIEAAWAEVDDTMSFAASLSRRFEVMVPTLQTSVSYLRPTPIARVIARGEVLRFGKSSVTLQGTLRDTAGQLLAVATATAVPRPFPRLP